MSDVKTKDYAGPDRRSSFSAGVRPDKAAERRIVEINAAATKANAAKEAGYNGPERRVAYHGPNRRVSGNDSVTRHPEGISYFPVNGMQEQKAEKKAEAEKYSGKDRRSDKSSGVRPNGAPERRKQ
jgi:hypothetical protein